MAGRPTKEGWLYKEGGAARNKWQARWFVLRGDSLLYYSKKEDLSTPLGCIKLSETDDVSKVGEHSGRQYCLAIVGAKGSSKKVYYLSADHEIQLSEWYVALKAASSINHGVKLTKYATVEVFLNEGVRVNGDVNYQILTSLSMRTSPEKKQRDHLGWFCQREVALSTVLNLFAQYSWFPEKIYRSAAYLPSDNGIHPVIRVIFIKSPFTSNKELDLHFGEVTRGHITGNNSDKEPVTLAGLGGKVLEGADDELVGLMQEFNIPLSLLQINSE